jgi:light-regulated signal transduction histidine kinase (bacteriophytochrome)
VAEGVGARGTGEPATPFGEADLATCEHEQIHIPGSIQPHGALLIADPASLEIVQASRNASALLSENGNLVGDSLAEAFGDDLIALVRQAEAAESDQLVHGTIRRHDTRFVVSLHSIGRQGVAIELEVAPQTPPDRMSALSAVLDHVSTALSLERLCSGFAQLFRSISGYDRVMVYRFDPDGHGEVFAEDRREDLEPFLGNHYPASDIPQRARRLYIRNRVRILGDVDGHAQPVEPALSPLDGEALDMSMCVLRSQSPIHLQYLRNMGVAATLVSSIMVGGRLWGLVACHHYAPRVPAPELRSLTELLSEMLGVRISALASLERIHAELRVRSLEQRMAQAVSDEGEWRRPLLDDPAILLSPVRATGAALLCDGEVFTVGDVPATRDIKALARRLLSEAREDDVYTTSSVARDQPDFAHLEPDAAGIMASRLSVSDADWIFWFRPEQVHTVTWGGDPGEAIIAADDLKSLTPRRSFAAWHQVVEGTSAPWSETDEAFGRLAGGSVGDVLLQFRAVRSIIARDQLRRVDAMVRASGSPAAIIEPNGRIGLANVGFGRLFGEEDWSGRPLEDLAPHFGRPEDFLALCLRVLDQRQLARSELTLRNGPERTVPVFVRADVIAASSDEVLGMVVMFTDLSDRRAALLARERFQRIVDSARDPIGAAQSPQAGEILDGLLENAAFAALELVQGIEISEAPVGIRALEASVQRSRRLLDEIVRDAGT